MDFSGPSTDEISVNANRLRPTAHARAPLQNLTTMVEPNSTTSVERHPPTPKPRASPRTKLNDLFDPLCIQCTSQMSTTKKLTEDCSSKQSGRPKPKSRKGKKGLTISDFVESDCK